MDERESFEPIGVKRNWIGDAPTSSVTLPYSVPALFYPGPPAFQADLQSVTSLTHILRLTD